MTGVTVLPEFIQNEGIEGVLDKLTKAKVTSVTTSPYVMEPADERTGSREPPIDAGAGKVRLLDRPLWGRRELFIRTAPSFVPDVRLYQGLQYQSASPTDLTTKQGPVVGYFIRAAKARKMKVYLQVQAAIPPGYRVQFGGPRLDDKPRLPDGNIPLKTLANNGSLASQQIRSYTAALLKDLLRAYPDVDGFRIDWPEYPPYLFDDLFLDFSEHARRVADRLGFQFERMRQASERLYNLLIRGNLTNAHLEHFVDRGAGRYTLMRSLMDDPSLLEWLRFKSVLVQSFIGELRTTLNQAGGAQKELFPQGFPPPFSLVSGFDYRRIAMMTSAIPVKLYTMHWPVMFNFYASTILEANANLSEELLVRALQSILEITDENDPRRTIAEYRYPEPHEPHPAGEAVQTSKIQTVQMEIGNKPVIPIVHGYGPPRDFARRLSIARRAAKHEVWINRYGYLSDEKLDIIART